MAQRVELTATVSENQLGQRLDQALAELFPDYSRSRIKEWILDQRVLVNGKIWDKPKEKVLGGEAVAINAEIEEEIRFEPQDIPLDIVYEDDDILVINKPRDLVVHPGAGTLTVRYLTHFSIIIRRSRMFRARVSFTVWIKTPPV
jgi:23S rRNA pseudouridine1911/1915/1917 synthase